MDALEPTVMECPGCGRLWVGRFMGDQTDARIPTFSTTEVHNMQGSHWRPEYLQPDATRSTSVSVRRCHSTAERVARGDVVAAYLIGGKEAAEALWPAQVLKHAVEAYEFSMREGTWMPDPRKP